MRARSEESFRESVELFRLFRKKREELEKNDEAGLAMFSYTRDQLCTWEDRLRELGVDVSGDKPRLIPTSAEHYPRTQNQIAKMKLAIESAFLQYHQWKIIALVGMHVFHTTADDPEAAAFNAMWDVWESHLFAKTAILATSETTTAHKPSALGQMAGYVRSHINLNEVPRLCRALQEEGPGTPPERLEEKLPSAALLAWSERSPDEPLRPVSGKRQTNLISRVEDIIVKEAGREAILHPTCVTDESLEEMRNLGTPERELEEFAALEELFAKLSEGERKVIKLTAQGFTQPEIAEKLHITVGAVKKTKSRARKKWEELRQAAEQ